MQRKGYFGISGATKQYNRSCAEHLYPAPDPEWEYLIPKLLPREDE